MNKGIPFSGQATFWVDGDRVNVGFTHEKMDDGVRLSAPLSSWTGKQLQAQFHRDQVQVVAERLRDGRHSQVQGISSGMHTKTGQTGIRVNFIGQGIEPAFLTNKAGQLVIDAGSTPAERITALASLARRARAQLDAWNGLPFFTTHPALSELLALSECDDVMLDPYGLSFFTDAAEPEQRRYINVRLDATDRLVFGLVGPVEAAMVRSCIQRVQAMPSQQNKRILIVPEQGMKTNLTISDFSEMDARIALLSLPDLVMGAHEFSFSTNSGQHVDGTIIPGMGGLGVSAQGLEERTLVALRQAFIDWNELVERDLYTLIFDLNTPEPSDEEMRQQVGQLLENLRSVDLEAFERFAQHDAGKQNSYLQAMVELVKLAQEN